MIEQIIEKILTKMLIGRENEDENHSQIGQTLIGTVCMFRTRYAGVHYGALIERDGQECLLKDSRRVHKWEGAASLSQLSIDGSQDIDSCRIGKTLPLLLLTEVYEIIPMTVKAIKNLNSKTWEI